MSPLEPNRERRRLRAPREEGEVLAIPPFSEMPAVVTTNRELIATWDAQVLGRPLVDLRRLAREEILTAAERFTHPFDLRASDDNDRSLAFQSPLIVGGHQPELFHPGVWAKNFALDRLAKATGGIGLHLIVDNDAVSSTRIAVPVGSREAPQIEWIPFDADAGSTPWEELLLRDETLFCNFADRVSAALACWPLRAANSNPKRERGSEKSACESDPRSGFGLLLLATLNPLLPQIWPAATEQITRAKQSANATPPRLSDLLTAVRREAEQRCGLDNFELPISQLCETESFAWFVCALLSDPQRTHATYNDVVAEYRFVNRVRNRQHPVPDLGVRAGDSEGDWIESPFWIWKAGDSRRGRLFVRTTATELQLANGETVIETLPRPLAETAEDTIAALRRLSSLGWKLRPRALTNTLFARVFFADAFLHGIGGAKYDEMTDRLITQLFGLAPPSYLTVTATHRLPLGGWKVTPSDVATLKHRLWDFDHTPERHVSSEAFAAEFAELLTEKQQLIGEQHAQDVLDRHDPHRASRADNNQRRHHLRAISLRLAEIANITRETLIAEIDTAESRLAANAILDSREFSFCLFPFAQPILPSEPTDSLR